MNYGNTFLPVTDKKNADQRSATKNMGWVREHGASVPCVTTRRIVAYAPDPAAIVKNFHDREMSNAEGG